jgi:hypothetical protein
MDSTTRGRQRVRIKVNVGELMNIIDRPAGESSRQICAAMANAVSSDQTRLLWFVLLRLSRCQQLESTL